MRSRARLRRADRRAHAGSRQGPPRSGAGAPTRTPAAHRPHQPGTQGASAGQPSPGHWPPSRRPDAGASARLRDASRAPAASLRDDLRPPL